MTPTAEQLLAIARDYFRPDDPYEGPPPYDMPEILRFYRLWEQQKARYISRWSALVRALERELPTFTLRQMTGVIDSSLKVGAYPARGQPLPPVPWAVVGCLSILAPIYTVYAVAYESADDGRPQGRVLYGPLPPEMRHPADVIARQIEKDFEATALPPDIAATPIPLRAFLVEPPETTLFHAFFSNRPAAIP